MSYWRVCVAPSLQGSVRVNERSRRPARNGLMCCEGMCSNLKVTLSSCRSLRGIGRSRWTALPWFNLQELPRVRLGGSVDGNDWESRRWRGRKGDAIEHVDSDERTLDFIRAATSIAVLWLRLEINPGLSVVTRSRSHCMRRLFNTSSTWRTESVDLRGAREVDSSRIGIGARDRVRRPSRLTLDGSVEVSAGPNRATRIDGARPRSFIACATPFRMGDAAGPIHLTAESV